SISGAEIPLCKGFFRFFDSKKQPMRLSIYRNPCVTAERGRHLHVFHHIVCNIIFQVAVVLKGGVQRQFVQSIIGIAFLKMVKLQLQAVSFQSIFLYQTPGIISLCTETCIRKPFSVYDNITLKVSFRGSSFKKCIPVINLQVNGMYPAVVKKAALIFGRGAYRLYAK